MSSAFSGYSKKSILLVKIFPKYRTIWDALTFSSGLVVIFSIGSRILCSFRKNSILEICFQKSSDESKLLWGYIFKKLEKPVEGLLLLNLGTETVTHSILCYFKLLKSVLPLPK